MDQIDLLKLSDDNMLQFNLHYPQSWNGQHLEFHKIRKAEYQELLRNSNSHDALWTLLNKSLFNLKQFKHYRSKVV